MPEDLWPDFQTEPRPRTVRRALIEAGEGLPKQTDGKIQFVVETTPASRGKFSHDCYLVVPALAYRYPLCKVVEEGDPYPVTLVGDGTFQNGVAARDERMLVENLKLLFRSEATKNAVLQLLDLVS